MVKRMMAHPQDWLPAVLVGRSECGSQEWTRRRPRKRYLPMGPQKPKSSSGSERGAVGGVDALEQADGLGADEDLLLVVAGERADGGAEQRELGLGAGEGIHAAGADGDVLGVDEVVEGDHGGVLRRVGQEDGAEVLVAEAGKAKGAVEGGAAGDLLGGGVVVVAVGAGVDLLVGVARGGLHVAEAGGPAQQRADRDAVAEDDGVGVDEVVGAEGEGLVDGDVAGGVVEAERRGRLQVAGGRRDVERGGELLGKRGVVGVERERMAVERRASGVDQVERLTGVVLVLLEDPGGDLRAAVGEGDAVELVLDDGRGFGRGAGRRAWWRRTWRRELPRLLERCWTQLRARRWPESRRWLAWAQGCRAGRASTARRR